MKSQAPFSLPKAIPLHMSVEDITEAICNSRSQCAIARNIYRQLDVEPERVRVSISGVSIAKDGYRYYYRVPRAACRLVNDFDHGKEVKPIHYKLTFTTRSKIAQVDPERAATINHQRNTRNRALYEMGLQPKTYPKGRYGI